MATSNTIVIQSARVDQSRDPFGPKEWVAVIRGFFDDSGKENNPSSRAVCMAGYLLGDFNIGAFVQSWNMLLMRYGISWVHMKDLMYDQDEYKPLKWYWPKKKRVIESFAALINSFQLVGFGVAIDAESWREIPKEITDREGNAQQFCFLRIMKLVKQRVALVSPDDYVSVIFDCDKEFTPVRFQRYLDILDADREAKRVFRSFAIADPKTFIPLQAADFLAWETRKEIIRKTEGLSSRPEFEVLLKTLPEFPQDYIGEFWTKDEIYKGFGELLKKKGHSVPGE